MTPHPPSPESPRRGGPGKWPAEDLARLLKAYASVSSPEVKVGPAIGLDAAVVRVGETDLVLATDPITFATDAIGWYAVTVNANDVAACGAVPRFFVAAALLPVEAGPETAEAIFSGLADACRAMDILLVGGHTERTAGLDRPIVCGTMLGDLQGREPVTSAGARPEDAVVLTKGAAIEATALIARERGDRLAGAVDAQVLERGRNFLFDPGINVVDEARIAREHGAHALHDVTEGGVVTGLWEMARASGLGIEVDADAICVRDETRLLCDAVGIDPLEAIGSGALVAAAAPDEAEEMLAALASAGMEAAVVGRFTQRGGECRITRGGHTSPLVPPAVDAIVTLYESGY